MVWRHMACPCAHVLAAHSLLPTTVHGRRSRLQKPVHAFKQSKNTSAWSLRCGLRCAYGEARELASHRLRACALLLHTRAKRNGMRERQSGLAMCQHAGPSSRWSRMIMCAPGTVGLEQVAWGLLALLWPGLVLLQEDCQHLLLVRPFAHAAVLPTREPQQLARVQAGSAGEPCDSRGEASPCLDDGTSWPCPHCTCLTVSVSQTCRMIAYLYKPVLEAAHTRYATSEE